MAIYEVTTDKGTYEVETEEMGGGKTSGSGAGGGWNPDIISTGAYKEIAAPIIEGMSTAMFGVPRALMNQMNPQLTQRIMPEQQTLLGKLLRGVSETAGFVGGGVGKLGLKTAQMTKQIPQLAGNKLLPKIGRTTIGGAVAGASITPEDDLLSPKKRAVQALEGGLLGAGIEGGGQVALKMFKQQQSIVNSLIRPRHKEYLFGKDPGKGISREGIIATDFEDLHNQVNNKLDELNSRISEIKTNPKNMDVRIDVAKSLQPLYDIRNELKQSPRMQQTHINSIENAIADIVHTPRGKFRKLNQISLDDAYKLKNMVSKMQNWISESPSQDAVNKSIRKVYHIIDESIDKSIPELKQLNERTANMISAKQAIENRMEIIRKQEPNDVLKLVNAPLAPLRSTLLKTLIGRASNKQYKQ